MGKIILESKKLSKAYSNGANKLDVIKNLNLKVKTAEIVTIVGQSGAGKTTLLNLIGGLDHPDSGELIILGKNILEIKIWVLFFNFIICYPSLLHTRMF